jgi:microcin C transport system permease protein
MRAYFLRRFLLIPPTLLGVTLVVFLITRIVPGGPAERVMQAAMARAAGDRGGGGAKDAGGNLSEEQKQKIKEDLSQDLPFFTGYLTWLGALPREVDKVRAPSEKGKETPLALKTLLPKDQWKPNNAYLELSAAVDAQDKLVSKDGQSLDGWHLKFETTDNTRKAVVFRRKFQGMLQGYFGNSVRYHEDVLGMIGERLPVSFFYAILTIILSYAICIPLGIVKAIKHRTATDNVSSFLIFAGYAVPGFALGSILVVFLAGRLGWFPIGGFTSENFASLSFGGKIADLFHHAALPLVCYLMGEFALLTMLTKNNLMDNLSADYVRTAVAKGATWKRAVFGHAVRNSLIPVCTTVGHAVVLFVGGSILIEKIFDINGFGLMTFSSLLDRDWPLVMAVTTISSLAMMLGNILADFLVAVADPRIRFS